jgi:hypothetical protein
MGFNDQFAVLVRNCHSACLPAHRLARRGSDKRSSRLKPDMDIPSPPPDSDFLRFSDWKTPACIQRTAADPDFLKTEARIAAL